MDECITSTLKGNWDVVLKYSKVIPYFYKEQLDVSLLAKVLNSYLSVLLHVLNINISYERKIKDKEEREKNVKCKKNQY
jgi:hypothetical protein